MALRTVANCALSSSIWIGESWAYRGELGCSAASSSEAVCCEAQHIGPNRGGCVSVTEGPSGRLEGLVGEPSWARLRVSSRVESSRVESSRVESSRVEDASPGRAMTLR